MPLTTTPPRSAPTTGVIAAIDDLLDRLDGEVLVSQNRWVDHLLDLYNLAADANLRREIATVLQHIRSLRSVRASELRDHLLTVAASVEVESALRSVIERNEYG